MAKPKDDKKTCVEYFRTDTETHAWLRQLATKHGLTVASILNIMVLEMKSKGVEIEVIPHEKETA